jgi:hypothetical protein
MKVLKPLPHAVLDYAMAGTLMAAPWLLGFKKNKSATVNSVASGAGILGLSLMTRYPLGAVGLISFPTHGIIETTSAAMLTAAPWLFGYADNERAKWTHVISGLATLAVVAITDYNAAEYRRGERGAGLAEQTRGYAPEQPEPVNLGPRSSFLEEVDTNDRSSQAVV